LNASAGAVGTVGRAYLGPTVQLAG